MKKQKEVQKPQSVREIAEEKFNSARSNLLLVVILTLINMVLLVVGSDSMMLFSATIPYWAMLVGIVSVAGPFFIGGIAVGVILLGIYFACWFFSKKHYGWMIAALVLFIIDTIFLAGLYLLIGDVSGWLDIIIHIWVLYYLIMGVKYGRDLKLLPEETEYTEPAAEEIEE